MYAAPCELELPARSLWDVGGTRVVSHLDCVLRDRLEGLVNRSGSMCAVGALWSVVGPGVRSGCKERGGAAHTSIAYFETGPKVFREERSAFIASTKPCHVTRVRLVISRGQPPGQGQSAVRGWWAVPRAWP